MHSCSAAGGSAGGWDLGTLGVTSSEPKTALAAEGAAWGQSLGTLGVTSSEPKTALAAEGAAWGQSSYNLSVWSPAAIQYLDNYLDQGSILYDDSVSEELQCMTDDSFRTV